MKTIKDLLGKHSGEKAIVLGAGSSVKEFKPLIDNFIQKNKPFTIGINNITDFWIPNYHLWTNNNRFRTFGKNIKNESTVLIGSNISLKVIREILGSREYVLLNRVDREGVPIEYRNGVIYGFHRTAGCLAITIAHLMGASEIAVVGMDGHTLHNYEDILSGKEKHHCYEENYKPVPLEIGIKKDKVIDGVLKTLRDYGMNFRILTPTKYEKYYDCTGLYV